MMRKLNIKGHTLLMFLSLLVKIKAVHFGALMIFMIINNRTSKKSRIQMNFSNSWSNRNKLKLFHRLKIKLRDRLKNSKSILLIPSISNKKLTLLKRVKISSLYLSHFKFKLKAHQRKMMKNQNKESSILVLKRLHLLCNTQSKTRKR